MSSAALLAIGDELLSGARQETNGTFLAWHLHDAGWDVRRIETIPDEEDRIVDALGRWIGEVDLLVLSGGLGPTHDDRTRDALGRYLGRHLVSDPLYDRVVSRYDSEHRELLEKVRDTQSMVPEGTRAVYDPEGTALGIAFERDGTRVLSLPGVPMEFRAMVRQELPELFVPTGGWASVVVLGVPEPLVVERVPDVIMATDLHVSVLPSSPTVELIVRGDPERVAEADALIRSRFDDVLPKGCRTLAEAVLHEGRRLGMTVACAESCTGGLVQAALTDVPGSSDVFKGGIVAYSDEIKERVLGVPREILDRHGAVSRECAEAMARGALQLCGSGLAVSSTGIAGPSGATPTKPVGTVWLAVARRTGDAVTTSASLRAIRGSRGDVRDRAVARALTELWHAMRGAAARGEGQHLF